MAQLQAMGDRIACLQYKGGNLGDKKKLVTNAGRPPADGIHGLAVALYSEEREREHVGDDSRKS